MLFPLGFALALLTAVYLLAEIIGRTIPFFRDQLAVEDASRLTPLDGVRGILCFSVMAHHCQMTTTWLETGVWTSPINPVYRAMGEFAVAIFFSITGFLFWTRVLATEGRLAPWPFFRARLFRIAPLYFFSVGLVFIVLAALHFQDFKRLLSPDLARVALKIPLMGIRPWGNLGNTNLGDINASVTWTLRYEWAFYLLLPVLAAVVQAGRSAWLLWLVPATLLVIYSDNYAIGHERHFIPGILAAYAARRPALAAKLRSQWVALAVIAALILCPYLPKPRGGPLLTSLALTIAFVPMACGNSLFGLLNLRGLRLMGILSFSVYLLHGIALYLTRKPLAQSLPHFGEYLSLQSPTTLFIALACVTLIFCCLTYRFIEFPAMAYERKTRPTPTTATLVKDTANEAATAATPTNPLPLEPSRAT